MHRSYRERDAVYLLLDDRQQMCHLICVPEGSGDGVRVQSRHAQGLWQQRQKCKTQMSSAQKLIAHSEKGRSVHAR